MGPVFHLFHYIDPAAEPGEEAKRRAHRERVAAVLADDGRNSFETHPDIQEVLKSLGEWYDWDE